MIHLHWETTASPERDAASPAEDPVSPERDAASPAEDPVSPEGDLLASPNFGICDTTPLNIFKKYFFMFASGNTNFFFSADLYRY
jgi:hypothetical protein